jgi:phage shock protein C
MQTSFSAPIARDDTLLGVCQSLGEDFGFNPNWLRVGLGAALLWNPVGVIAVYGALAVMLAVSRWTLPDPRAKSRPEADWTPAPAAAEDESRELPLAA